MKISIQSILDAVKLHFGVTEAELFYKSRVRHVVEKRMIFFYLSKWYADNYRLTYMMGFLKEKDVYFDHATLIHAAKTIQNLTGTNLKIREDIDAIKDIFKNNIPIIAKDIDLVKLCHGYSATI